MDKCYLFGAGINCFGVIKFIGKENIIAVVDNNESKIGLCIEGIKIIHFLEFLMHYCGETVIISAYYARNEIKKQLQENGVKNYIVSPYMQKGYYESYRDIIYSFEINKKDNIYIYGENYFSKNLLNALKECDIDILVSFVKDSKYREKFFYGYSIIDLSMVPDGANVLLATDEYNDKDIEILKCNRNNINIIDIYQTKMKEHIELQKFSNMFSGKRCFIVGNGPSLRIEDLNILQRNNEICFASNWIIKAFSKTKWRPNFYVVVDYNFMRQMPQDMRTLNGEKIIIFHADVFNSNMEDKDNVYTYQAIPYNQGNIRFSNDIAKGIYGSLTVTYDMIQIAAYMGFKEIYLLGIDCSNGSRHFYNDDIDKSKLENCTVLDDNGWNRQYSAWICGYKKAEENSKKGGFRIYNATRGGELEVFERVDFDSLF